MTVPIRSAFPSLFYSFQAFFSSGVNLLDDIGIRLLNLTQREVVDILPALCVRKTEQNLYCKTLMFLYLKKSKSTEKVAARSFTIN